MRISLNDIRRAGGLVPGSIYHPPLPDYSFHGSIVFRAMNGHAQIYRYHDDGSFDKSHRVEYGRTRIGMYPDSYQLWFVCACRARVAVLYVDWEGTIGCRHCFRALHQSTSENPLNRALAKAYKIRARLATKQGMTADPDDNTFPPRPKLTPWRLYNQLQAKHAQILAWADAQYAAVGFSRKLGVPPLKPRKTRPKLTEESMQAQERARLAKLSPDEAGIKARMQAAFDANVAEYAAEGEPVPPSLMDWAREEGLRL